MEQITAPRSKFSKTGIWMQPKIRLQSLRLLCHYSVRKCRRTNGVEDRSVRIGHIFTCYSLSDYALGAGCTLSLGSFVPKHTHTDNTPEGGLAPERMRLCVLHHLPCKPQS